MSATNRFNWIAPAYDRLAKLVFGDELHHAQVTFLSDIGAHDHVLIIGGGSGKFLHTLMLMCPHVEVTYVEASSRMIALAKTQVADGGARVHFIHGTERDIPADAQFDVVITHFFLDVFTDESVKNVIDRLVSVLRGDGKWIVTEFNDGPRWRHHVMLRVMYIFFHLTKSIDATRMNNWRSQMEKVGLKVVAEKIFLRGFVSAVLSRKLAVK